MWSSPAGPRNVAIKSLREESSDEDRVKLFQEAAINGQFHHPSVIILHGVVTVGKKVNKELMSVNVLTVWYTFQPMIVLELMEGGDMKAFLQKLQSRY